MRLSTEQTRLITRTVSHLTGGSADVYVFGSRLDDTARGGDIDLLLESAAPLGLIQRASSPPCWRRPNNVWPMDWRSARWK